MSKTNIRVDEDSVFNFEIRQNGVLTDVQGGVASLSGKSLFAIRDGVAIELDPTAGVTFTKVGTVDGIYSATFDRTAMTDQSGAPFAPAVGDDLKFVPQAEVVAGQPLLEGKEEQVCIIDANDSETSQWAVC